MPDMAYITTKTSYKINDILKMPYAQYRCLYKELRIMDYMQIPEWREAYFIQMKEQAHKEGKIIKKTETDIEGLKALKSIL
jgi:hypothetical protein